MHSAFSSHRENNGKKFDAVSKRIDSVQANVSDNEKNVGSCLAEMIKLQKRLNMLEDRSRIYDVRLVNLPSEAEGDDPKGRRCCRNGSHRSRGRMALQWRSTKLIGSSPTTLPGPGP